MAIPLIVNPAAGRGSGERLGNDIRAQLAAHGVTAELICSRAPGDVAVRVQAALRDQPECILIAGGDGSVHEAVNGWLHAGGGAPLGIIPVGTGNDFAKMVAPHADWREACARIAHGKCRDIDVGRCNDFYFANSIGLGFDAQVALEANHMQWLHSKIVYGVALFKTLLLDHRTPTVHIRGGDIDLKQPITLVAINNGRVEGGSFVLAPNAEIDDGLLDVVIAGGLSRLGILRLVPRVLAGTHLTHRCVTAFRTTKLTIDSDTGLTVHADGEIRYLDATRLEIEVMPKRLSVMT